MNRDTDMREDPREAGGERRSRACGVAKLGKRTKQQLSAGLSLYLLWGVRARAQCTTIGRLSAHVPRVVLLLTRLFPRYCPSTGGKQFGRQGTWEA